MKRFAVLLAVVLIPGVACSQLPVYYGALYGMVADDFTDNCGVFGTPTTGLLGIVAAAGGGIIQLPLGPKFTKLSSCDLVLPANVIIAGSGAPGWNTGAVPKPSSGLHMINSSAVAHIQCLYAGTCGLQNLEVLDDATSTTFMLYTASVPYLDHVIFVGMTAANSSPTNCVHSGPCPVNDGIYFGVAGQINCAPGPNANPLLPPNSDFCGYGDNHIQDLYFQNIKKWMLLSEDANGINVRYIRGDFTDANKPNYAIELHSSDSMHPTYGNTFVAVNAEQNTYGLANSTFCAYQGVFGLTGNAVGNLISYETSDVGACQHGTYITDTGSVWNDITQIDTLYMNGTLISPAVFDVNGASYSNGIYDMPNKTLYRQTYLGGNLGTTSNPFNYLRLAVGIDSPSNVTGIPNADKFGGIVGLSNTTASTFGGTMGTNIYYPLFSDTSVTGSPAVPFTVFPLEAWLGQFTLNTSNNNGSAPMQMQPIYFSGGSAQVSPIVFSIAPGQAPGTPVSNAPPFYVSAGNPISFQAVNTPAPNGSTFATVNGFAASLIGTADTVLGTYYSGTVPGGLTYYTSFSQKTGWTNSGPENLAYTVMPFAYTVQGLCVYTSSSQPVSNPLTVKLRQNGGYPSPQPAVSIPGGGGSGTWCDNAHHLMGSANDWLDLELKNNNTSGSSANIVSIAMDITPASPATGMFVFGLGGIGIMPTSPADTYFAPFGGSTNLTTTHVNAEVAVPRALTVKNMHCYVTACPGSGLTVTISVYQNGGPPPMGSLSVNFGHSCSPPRDITDLSGSIGFLPGQTIELHVNQGGAGLGGPELASCTMEHD
ncbi:MAG: hypothetical protein P4L87_11470 [Formivibrio sp.]|nr:hypothetical protein [Formivibrio sp.]